MVKVSTLGPMGASTSASMKTIKKMDWALLAGPTVASTAVDGVLENSTARQSLRLPTKNHEKVTGKTVNAQLGLRQIPVLSVWVNKSSAHQDTRDQDKDYDVDFYFRNIIKV